MSAQRIGRARLWLLALALGAGACRAHAPATPTLAPGEFLVRCRGGAARAWAVGSFNGWERPGAPLQRGQDGVFARILTPGPGPVLVACLLEERSGEARMEPPLNAERLIDDDFGGQNGLYDVPDGCGAACNLAAGPSSMK